VLGLGAHLVRDLLKDDWWQVLAIKREEIRLLVHQVATVELLVIAGVCVLPFLHCELLLLVSGLGFADHGLRRLGGSTGFGLFFDRGLSLFLATPEVVFGTTEVAAGLLLLLVSNHLDFFSWTLWFVQESVSFRLPGIAILLLVSLKQVQQAVRATNKVRMIGVDVGVLNLDQVGNHVNRWVQALVQHPFHHVAYFALETVVPLQFGDLDVYYYFA